MTNQLEQSIRSSQSVADIDRLILGAADLDTVVRKVLLTARMEGVDVTLMLRPARVGRRLISYQMNARQLQRQPVKLRDALADSLLDIDGFQRLAYQVSWRAYRLLSADGAGRAACWRAHRLHETHSEAAETKQLTDLADRLAVAMTSIHRSEVLYQKAHFDDLTGLINRHAFQDKLKEQISRSWRGETGAVLFIDLDGFKKVNDTEGHKAGDRLLVVIANDSRNPCAT